MMKLNYIHGANLIGVQIKLTSAKQCLPFKNIMFCHYDR